MKLKLIGMTTMILCAGAAQAQTSVTLYGAIDTGLMYQNTTAANFSQKTPDTGTTFRYKDAGMYASTWGMKGSEDLGGGYHANFRLQGAFNSGSGAVGLPDTTGTVAVFNQVTSVGLSGPFGSVDVGRQYAAMAWALVDTDVRGAEYFGSAFTAWIGMNTVAGWLGSNTNGAVGAVYDSNAIIYKTPNFNGVTLSLEYAPGEVAGNNTAGSRESAVLQYVNGGLHLSGVYYNAHDTNLTPASPAPSGVDNNRFIQLGALYDMGSWIMSASYSNGKTKSLAPYSSDIDMYSAGLGYHFSPVFKITSGVYYLKDKNNSLNKSTSYALGAEYQLSKRTTLYGDVGRVDNKGNMNQTLSYGSPVAQGLATTAVMLGMRHTF
ncbi:Outer membrane protein [Collimonas arenae]|uniref:Outer membrane protein n=1 Tax=Collimonas arenae TaxID=279058 RepID=A0A0A1FD67_9BURK|nr:porin [Collimonas arenae]AIY41720.1 Outer membrane protein [Collimonas arenae]